MAGGEKVPDDFVGVVMSMVDGVAVFSGPGDTLPEGNTLKGADNPGKSPAEQVAAIAAPADGDDESGDGGDEFDSMTKAELVAAVEEANAGRDEESQLSVSGNKAELAERLRNA